MDSDEVRAQRRAAERAAAAPHIDQPPTPWWFPPVVGLCGGGLTAVWALDGPAFAGVMVGLLIALSVVAVRQNGRSEVRSDVVGGDMPPEIRRQYWMFGVGLPATAAVVIVLVWLVGHLVAAGVAVVLVTGLLYGYRHGYARAAERVRTRLS